MFLYLAVPTRVEISGSYKVILWGHLAGPHGDRFEKLKSPKDFHLVPEI